MIVLPRCIEMAVCRSVRKDRINQSPSFLIQWVHVMGEVDPLWEISLKWLFFLI